jgi:hypothetical protein
LNIYGYVLGGKTRHVGNVLKFLYQKNKNFCKVLSEIRVCVYLN